MKRIEKLLANNKKWSREITRNDPRFFSDLAKQQNPEYLWIGCSDSRVSANTIVGLKPGEIFVHRNIANLVNHTDFNCLSVIQFAVDLLQVGHIIVCGHYGCSGVEAAFGGHRHGLVDNWLRQIDDTINLHAQLLAQIEDEGERFNKLCQLNVAEQVLNVGSTTVVQDAWDKGQRLMIHGWIYGLDDGMIRDLDITIGGPNDLTKLRDAFLFRNKRDVSREASN